MLVETGQACAFQFVALASQKPGEHHSALTRSGSHGAVTCPFQLLSPVKTALNE
jgi:hypothetical protein